ncbi:hypothetical protein ACEPPU_29985 (plasmid) [Priestia aryabhattai]
MSSYRKKHCVIVAPIALRTPVIAHHQDLQDQVYYPLLVLCVKNLDKL